MKVIKVLRNEFRDSLYLLRLSTEASGWPEVKQAVVVSGTENNKLILEQVGLLQDEARQARPDDIILALELEGEVEKEAVLDRLVTLLQNPQAPKEETASFSQLSSALSAVTAAQLVIVSTPGEYAADLIEESLENEKNVFCFSHHVSVEDELRLKKLARKSNLLLMGPDAGTAILDGYGIGFANIVRRGVIGLVSASGSGLQEVTSIIHRSGGGISQAIGVGGRDLLDPVNGLMAEMAVQRLASDPGTEIIVVLAKNSGDPGQRRVLQALEVSGKPYVVDFGRQNESDSSNSNESAGDFADTFEACAEKAIRLAGQTWAFEAAESYDASLLDPKLEKLEKDRKSLWGLYSGGSLAGEARRILDREGIKALTELDLDQGPRQQGHIVVDLGDEKYTAGRPHPFIDPRWRQILIQRAFQNPFVGVLLFDVVLGWGSHRDPAGELAASIEAARKQYGPGPVVIASVSGTEEDPQGFDEQRDRLRRQGAIVVETNARASRLAAWIVKRLEGR